MKSDRQRGGIYRIFLGGKYYVGSAICFQRRWDNHKQALRRGNHRSKHLQAAYNKYGEKAMIWEILELVDDPQILLEREQDWIDSTMPQFNKRLIASSNLGHVHSEESRSKMSAKAKGSKKAPRSAEHLARISAALKGRKAGPFSQERKDALSLALTGIKKGPQSEDHRRKISLSKKGKSVDRSPDHQRKLDEHLRKLNLARQKQKS